MIRLKNVEKSYPIATGQVFVLRRIDLEQLKDGWVEREDQVS